MKSTIKSVLIPPARQRRGAALPAAPGVRPGAETHPDASRAGPPRLAPRYHVGQRVTLLGGGNRWARVQSECHVLAVLPHENGPFQYRVRSEAENYERVVVETDLAAAH